MTYSIDTRTLQPGQLYAAIRGEVHDGHTFIPQAIEKGAAGIITEQDIEAPEGVEVIRVARTLDYLIEQATAKVRQLSPDIVAITGSVGKTTTRTAVHTVLAEAFAVVASEGNRNTPLGLSLLILNSDIAADTKLVLEMGARLEGDLRELCGYFPPNVSVVTNVKGVHVETFGSIDGVQREKSELVRALGPDGIACLNADDPRVRAMAELHAGRTIFYGTGPGCDVRPERITADLPLLGDHAVSTAMAAMSVGLAFGMDDVTINRGLAAIRPEKGRLNRLRGRNESILIDDTYNASPDTVTAALGVLNQIGAERRIAFLGDMLELGDTEIAAHTRTLAAALRSVDILHAVGERMAKAAEALDPDERDHIGLHPTAAALADAIRSNRVYQPRPGDAVLVKGSQGTRMERVSEALLHPDLDPVDVLPRQSESWKQIA